MSGTAEKPGRAEARAVPADRRDPSDAGELGAAEDQAYFHAIEATFIRLRGAPLLLSPADWRVARGWRRRGIPLELVRRTLEEVFARRAERGSRGRINSLRYCARAVQEAWEEVEALTAPGRRAEVPPLDVGGRLRALVASLPPALPERVAVARRIEALVEVGETEEVERRLAELDLELVEGAAAELANEGRRALEEQVDRTLAAVAARLGAEELEAARRRLLRQAVRERIGLPLLSLFAPEAEAGET